MHARVCVLVCVLSVCSALICPDGGMCDNGNTCCQMSWGGYGCCPLPNAECCSDHLHCCHEGTLCDTEHGTCVNKTHSLEWVRRVSAKQITLPQAVVCPDQESECPDDTTCCQMPDGVWGCCPMPNAVCCEDKRHCCPEGTKCDIAHSRCASAVRGFTPLLRKFPAIHKDAAVNKGSVKFPGSNDVICPDKVSTCPDDTTCCKLENGSYGCCPMPNAVCCEDYVHCCPEGTTCDLEHGSCDMVSELNAMTVEATPTLHLKPTVPAFPRPSQNINDKCDPSFSCPQDTTCCKMYTGDWGCCPLPQAVCCEDHLHCCPHNTVCNVQAGTCDSASDRSSTVPWVTKIPAVVMVSEKEHCDETSACPTGTTCCKQKSGTWACCLLPRAVCCGDGDHCCPSGYTCGKEKPTCTKGNLELPWFKKQPAISVTSGIGDVKCDDTTSCATGTTCCRLRTEEWGCCPLAQAVCCADREHCCPHDYTCDLQSGTCVKPSTTHTVPLVLTRVLSDKDDDELMCDATSRCSKSQTCCRSSDSDWACCPFEQAVCCEDMKHCCPKGYACDPKIRCTKVSSLTWWDNSHLPVHHHATN
ncbi:granulin b isoform X2 [Tachysurus fulvidraco]|uniref:granulin b isoform X2 n=1 Tax=Tachysurus fulvidraco TaxID=1234273 RepID=UPI001FEE9BB5|nr:granulin b isoform X2 [Tachysurus fulvidraco]